MAATAKIQPGGVSMFGLMTDATCGDACWAAREDICRCSCSGENHGITRTANGERPTRTRRVKEHRYQLLAVESPGGEYPMQTIRPIEDLRYRVNGAAHTAGLFDRYASTWPHQPAWPAIVNTASHSAVKGWPELAAWRGASRRPLVAWVREDMAHLAEENVTR